MYSMAALMAPDYVEPQFYSHTNLFNYNFVNIGAKYATVLSQQTHTFCPFKLEQLIEQRVPPNNCFKIPLISHQFVFKYINEMKGNKSTGHDDISARFIKLTAPYITDSIVKILALKRGASQTLGEWQELPQSTKKIRRKTFAIIAPYQFYQ